MNTNKKLTKFSAIALASALGLTLISGSAFANTATITLEKAKEIALKDAGLSASNVTFVKAKLDTKSGDNEYDIEFTSGDKEYDYEIDATSGSILEKDNTIEKKSKKTQTTGTTDGTTTKTKPSKDSTSTTVDTSKNIGLEKAKEIALKDAGLKASDVTFVKAKLDTRGGDNEYDIEFTSGGKEYDYEIDGVSGSILEKDNTIEKKSKSSSTDTTNSTTKTKPSKNQTSTTNSSTTNK